MIILNLLQQYNYYLTVIFSIYGLIEYVILLAFEFIKYYHSFYYVNLYSI